jgi:hypothetical protein
VLQLGVAEVDGLGDFELAGGDADAPLRRPCGQRDQSGSGATVAGENDLGLGSALETFNRPGKLGLCL